MNGGRGEAVIWAMFEEMERDELGELDYVGRRNGYRDRAAAATAILESGGVVQDPSNPARLLVPSVEHGAFKVYEVIIGAPPSCECDDHKNGHTYCKHILAGRRLYYLTRGFEIADGQRLEIAA